MNDPTKPTPAGWARLWQLAKRVGETTHQAPDYVFMPVGLRLETPTQIHAWQYDSTPVNVTTFASTGGDGVHFSFLHADGGDDTMPVVMTVPMAFNEPNHVVGRDLREFLALGSQSGYFCLERLAYGWGRQETVARLQAASPPADPEEATLLRHLAREFDLQHWRNVQSRLEELDTAHRARLRFRSDA